MQCKNNSFKFLFRTLNLIIIISLLPCFYTLSYASDNIDVLHFNVISEKFSYGTANIKNHRPIGTKVNYNVIKEKSFKLIQKPIVQESKDIAFKIVECTQKVLDSGIDAQGKPIIYENFGRIDSAAWKYSLTIAPVVVPMLEKLGIPADKYMWLCVADKKGKVTDLYLEVEDEGIRDSISFDGDYAYIFGTDDTHMSPNKPIERQEACAMIYRLLKQNNEIGDFVPQRVTEVTWSKNAMDYMSYIHLYDTTPQLTSPITRAEAFKIFSVGFGLTKRTDEPIEFYAELLKRHGSVIGYEDGSLRLSNNITRAEFCKVYNSITGRDKKSLKDIKGNIISSETYNILDLECDSWYYDTILKATSAYEGNYVDLSKRSKRNEVDYYR